jgi:hypothetical protein
MSRVFIGGVNFTSVAISYRFLVSSLLRGLRNWILVRKKLCLFQETTNLGNINIAHI